MNNKLQIVEARIGMTRRAYYKQAAKDGKSINEIAAELGISRLTAAKWGRAEGFISGHTIKGI